MGSDPRLAGTPYDSDMERRIMQGGYNCAGVYRLAPPLPAQWPADVLVPRRPIQRSHWREGFNDGVGK